LRKVNSKDRRSRPRETYAYTLEEIQTILAMFSEPAARAFAVAGFMGLRHSKIQGLLWENYRNNSRRCDSTRTLSLLLLYTRQSAKFNLLYELLESRGVVEHDDLCRQQDLTAIAQRFVDLSAHPQAVQQDC